MHLIIHTQYFPPEIGAPQNRLYEIAIGLIRHGFDITVLTAMPSYPRGRLYPGYHRCLSEEDLDGIRIIRTGIYPTQSIHLIPRLFSYFSFMLSSLLIGGWKLKRADYLLTESPPLFLGLAGFLLSKWKQSHWIFNVSDLWPQSVVELGLMKRNSISYRLSSTLEKFLYKQTWLITGQSETILANIQTDFSGLRTYHLSNGVDTGFFYPREVTEGDHFNIVYAGLHGLAQGLEQIILAAQKLKSDGSIIFTFVGDGPEKQKLVQLVKDLSLANVQFLEPIPKNVMPQLLNSAGIIIVPLKVQLTGAVPSKLYEAMSMAKPIILLAESEAANIVIEANCGIVVRPGDLGGLVNAIVYLKNNPEQRKSMGVNGRRTAITNHDRKQIVDNFAQFLKHAQN